MGMGLRRPGSPHAPLLQGLLLLALLPTNTNTASQHQAHAERKEETRLQTAIATAFLERSGNASLAQRRRVKRSVVHLYDMVACGTGCDPLIYKGYGCYCGFLGSGLSVDGIDRCCAKHDWCYNHAQCPPFLTYFVPYYWTCRDTQPQCVSGDGGWKGLCGRTLCECDRQFAQCLRKYPCPRKRAMCVTSPWRFWQNIIMQRRLPSANYDDHDG